MENKGLIKCWGCEDLIPDIFMHTHHKTPQGAGGGDQEDNLVNVCPSCHAAVHQTTHLVAQGKNAQARDALTLLSRGDAGWERRLLELVQQEARAWKSGDKRRTRLVTFEMPVDQYEQLKGMAHTMPRSAKTGKPMGVSRLLLGIVTRWMEDRVRTGLW